MDEALLKAGQWPNVAIEAGSDPAEVMWEYGRDVEREGFARGHSNVSKNLSDSREKLETDIMFEYLEFPGDQNRIFAYLDRQAAITERECMSRDTSERVGWDCAECAEGLGKELDARCDKLKERIADLTAERDALKEQINRFNASKSEEIAENDTSKGEINNFDVQNDTREKLEADIRAWHRDTPFATKPSVQTLLGWLDRQDAITRRECSPEAIDYMLNTIGELEEKVDELEAEVEAQRKRANDAERGVLDGRWYVCRDRYDDDIAELTAERDQLDRDLDAEHALVVQFEWDNEELRSTCNTLRASVAGLKSTVEKLRER